jgi:hypothetical protein
MASHRRPLLWGQEELDNEWFQRPRLDEALLIARSQELRRRAALVKSVPAARAMIGSDPDLEGGWFNQ